LELKLDLCGNSAGTAFLRILAQLQHLINLDVHCPVI